ncbi:DUF3137 domain-containing protein [Demequina sp.]|uniref:DUF3137 domain-containing protein n=1 Tax=Demequina sp. TaxID=2050685 RepID=UPI0025C6C11A|nr:DUF3137 domain-containing protein [Demequina sp.]
MAVDDAAHAAASDHGTMHRIATSRIMGLAPTVVIVGVTIVGIVAGIGGWAFWSWPGSSNMWATIGLFAGMVAGVVLGVRVGGWIKRAHARDFQEVTRWANGEGLTLSTSRRITSTARIEPFSHAGTHTAGATWAGRYRGQQVEIFYYVVDTGTARHPEKRAYTVVSARSNASPSVVEALPQRGAHAAAARVGARDVDVESAAFNRSWRVRADDERLAHELLTPRVIARLVDAAEISVPVAWDGPAVMCVTPGIVKDTDTLEQRLALVADLATLVPGYLRTDGAATGDDAAAVEAANAPSRVRKKRSNLELVVLLAGLAALWGGAWAWGRIGPGLGVPLLIVGFVIAFRTSRVVAFLERLRRRG